MLPGKVIREVQLENGNRVVLVDYEKPNFMNNLFSVNSADDVVWEAETILRMPYSNVMLSDGKLKAMSADGWLVQLDKGTGKIMSRTYVK